MRAAPCAPAAMRDAGRGAAAPPLPAPRGAGAAPNNGRAAGRGAARIPPELLRAPAAGTERGGRGGGPGGRPAASLFPCAPFRLSRAIPRLSRRREFSPPALPFAARFPSPLSLPPLPALRGPARRCRHEPDTGGRPDVRVRGRRTRRGGRSPQQPPGRPGAAGTAARCGGSVHLIPPRSRGETSRVAFFFFLRSTRPPSPSLHGLPVH